MSDKLDKIVCSFQNQLNLISNDVGKLKEESTSNIILQTNSVNNSTRSKLNLSAGDGITLSESNGNISISSTNSTSYVPISRKVNNKTLSGDIVLNGGDIFKSTTSKYIRGDGSIADFPTSLSSFTNTPGYLTSSSFKTIGGNSIIGVGDIPFSSNDSITSISGVLNRTTISGTTSVPIVDISSSYIGQTSISKLGAVTTGVWNASPISNTYLANNTIGLVLTSTTASDASVSQSPAILGANLLLNIPSASSASRGLLTAQDWVVFNNKQSAITLGSSSQYLRGDLTLASFPTIPAQFNLIAGTGVTLSGSYPNITINSSGGGSGSGVSSISGVANRTIISGISTTPIIDISSTYVGQASISTLGTISTGVWQGTPINVNYLASKTIGLAVTSTAGSDVSVTTSPATLGGNLIINIPSASATQRGVLSIADWNTFNSKQSTLPTGTSTQYLRGDKTLATFPTALSSFSNDLGYLTSTIASNTYVPLVRTINNKALSGNIILTGTDIFTGSVSQYVRGDGTLATYSGGGGGTPVTTDYIYASDYGVVGDNTTINTTANLQSFFNAISTTGKVGIFASGTYIINSDSTLEIKSNSNIIGHNATLQLNSGSTSTRYLVRIYPHKSNISIKGITFDGNAANNTGTNIAPLFVEDDVVNLNITDCKFLGSKDNAALTVKGSSSQNSQVSVVKCTFDLIARSAIEFRGVKNSVVERCIFTNWGSQSGHNGDSPALQLQSINSTDVKIIDNTFNNTLSTEFAIESGGTVNSGYTCSGVFVSGNFFIDNTTSGTSGGTGVSGYFNDSKFIDNTFIKGANNHHSGFEIFGSNIEIDGNTIPQGSIVVGAGSVTNVNVSKIKITDNIVTCVATNGSAIIASGYNTYSISDVDVSGNYISTIGGSGNSSAIKIGTYSTTSLAKEINIHDNTIYSSAYGIRLEAATSSQDIYIRDNQYKHGNQFIAVINNNLTNVRAIDNTNESGSAESYYAVTVTNPVIFYRTVTDSQISQWNTNTPTPVNYYDVKANGGATGNGTTDDSTAISNAILAAVAANKTLYFPAGTYLINNTVQLTDYATLVGIPKKTIFKTTTPSGFQYMFQDIAHGNIRIEGITFTNNFSTNMLTSFLKFQSSPNKCENININNCSFVDSYVLDAIEFGTSDSATNSCYFDNVIIDGCYINNLYGSQYGLAIPQDGSFYFQPGFCSGIRLMSDVLRYTIKNTIIRNVSGDCVCSYGRSPLSDPMYIAHYMEGHIYGCEFSTGNMCLELNGNHGGANLNVHDNKFFYPNREGGFAVSMSCENMNFHHNHVYTAERSALELCTVTGTVNNNIIKMGCWKDSTTGIAPTVLATRIHFMELNGYFYNVTNNVCEADRSNPTTNTPTEFNGISIRGRNSEVNQCDQRCTYNSISDYSTYWNIKNNMLNGCTHRMIESTNDPIRNVIIESNNFVYTTIQDNSIWMQGYNWQVKNNIFDLKLVTTNPSDRQLVYNHFVQTDPTYSIVYDNTVCNDIFSIGHSANVNYFNTKYQNAAGLVYTVTPAPGMTQSQRTSLTVKEGMQVYQTDATAGTYTYRGGSWIVS